MPPLRMVITDDHPLVRSGLRALLLAADDLEVVGEAATGGEAVTLACELAARRDVRLPRLFLRDCRFDIGRT